MTAIGAFEAKTHLSSLLDRVSLGEEITITKRGKPVARLVPVRSGKDEAQQALERMTELRQSTHLGHDLDWKTLRDAGRK